MTHSETIAKFIISLEYEDIPTNIISRAKQLLLDTEGVAIAGASHQSAKDGLAGIRSIPLSNGNIKVWGNEQGLSLPYAILANGLTAHVLDYDDTHTESIVHGSAILTPVIKGVGQQVNATGRDMLTAFVCGWEIAARVGQASKNTFHLRGFHSTAIAGIFGAVAAIAKLLNLNHEQLVNAFGLCGSQAGGVTEFLTNSSSSKAFHAGWVGHSALISCYMAKAGMTGPTTIFEGKHGVFFTHGNIEKSKIDLVSAELSHRWETGRVSIKPYPCCHFAHASIDCAIELHNESILVTDIENIHCYVDEVAAGFICAPIGKKHTPANSYGAKFSLPFLIACGVIDGEVNAGSFTEDNICRSDLLSFAKVVSYEYANPETSYFPKYFPAKIKVTLKNGNEIFKQIKINRGNPDAPMSIEDIIRKFKENTSMLLTCEEQQRIISNILNIDK